MTKKLIKTTLALALGMPFAFALIGTASAEGASAGVVNIADYLQKNTGKDVYE